MYCKFLIDDIKDNGASIIIISFKDLTLTLLGTVSAAVSMYFSHVLPLKPVFKFFLTGRFHNEAFPSISIGWPSLFLVSCSR